MAYISKRLVSTILFTSLFLGFQAHAVFVPEEVSGPIEDIESTNILMTAPAELTELTQEIERIYDPIVSRLGGKLTIRAQWGSKTPNAFAKKTFKNWLVVITGGLARHPKMTKDGVALVVCHELGHHVAGFPFAETGIAALLGMDWVANEGESDYYASHVCARKIWGNQKKQNEVFRSLATAQVKAECDKTWKSQDEQNLCYRTVTAGEALANVLADLSKKGAPMLHTPNQTVVQTTYMKHPEAQCRLDTYLNGALCPVKWNDAVVPGKKQKGGKKGIEAERQAALSSCTRASGYTIGLRPACWFKSRL